MRIIYGLSSGIGNAVFCLPAIKALHGLGHEVVLYVDGDYDMTALFERCVWSRGVVDGKRSDPPAADRYISGHWCPPRMVSSQPRWHYSWRSEPRYHCPEWRLAFDAAIELGWQGPPDCDTEGWCRGVQTYAGAEKQWDIGIVPGSKGDIWLRKRYPDMPEIAKICIEDGLSVLIVGKESDLDDDYPGVEIATQCAIEDLPDLLIRCRGVIGTDSGPTHLAASLGVPTTVVYTATSTVKGAPVGPRTAQVYPELACAPCQSTPRWMECSQWQCREIRPELVMSCMEELWQST